jgi:hypothetical protein
VNLSSFPTEIRAGDDEGSIEVTISNDREEHIVNVNLLVSGEWRGSHHLDIS